MRYSRFSTVKRLGYVALAIMASPTVLMPTIAQADPPPGYYDTVDDSSDTALRNTLHTVIDDHTRFPYTSSGTDTWDILELADEDPNNVNNILDIYRNATYPKAGGGNTDYNREHTWPTSYGFPDDNSSNYPYTDCHHLFLSDDGYNSSRSNKPYRYCDAACSENPTDANNGQGGGSGTYPGNSNWTTGSNTSGTWETWIDRRGDIARAQFYLDIRYEGGTHGVTSVPEPDLILTDTEALIASSNTGSNESVAYMGMLSELLQWHMEDPVDDHERSRNDVVYSFQGNRNPFVDHPEWVECLFDNVCGGSGGCTINADCDDGAFCNGYETCSAGTCQNGTDPCPGVSCDEIADLCVAPSGDPWINEFHYDNSGGDTGEFVEIAGPAGMDLTGWSVVGYNGNGGGTYNTVNLSGTIPDQDGCMGTLDFNFTGMQNGAPDGLALVHNGSTVIEFVSYEGSFTATNGPANGLTSSNVGVAESSTTPIGYSLQLTGMGSSGSDFAWLAPSVNTRGLPNLGQTFDGCGGCTVDADCDDGIFCNGAETCVAGACQPGVVVDCDDAVACTTDSCNETTAQCDNLSNDPSCDDGLYCNGAEFCDVIFGCQAGSTIDCDDGVACTDDSCNESTDSCDSATNNAHCDDGLFCNGSETCDGGLGCVAGSDPCGGLPCDEATDSCESLAGSPWINELHYDNNGSDAGEFVEVAGPAGLDLGGWSVVGYNGNGGSSYATVNLAGIIPNDSGCLGTLDFTFTGMQNGAPDGLALVDDGGAVVEFISYEGSFTAVGGPANGMTSMDIGVSEPGTTPIGQALQLAGTGNKASDFTWQSAAAETRGTVNTGQTFDGCSGCTIDADCDDGVFCNGVETCVTGACQSGSAVSCDDGVACTDDSCNEATDNCDNVADDANCDDGLYCNGAESCDPALDCLAGSAINCDDGVACTDDSCNETTDSCDNVADDAHCDDGLYCNGAESCDPALDCLAGSAVNCDDGVACTDDSCNETTDSCDNVADDANCDDGLYCNGAESCDPVLDCQAGSDPCPGTSCDEALDECISGPAAQLEGGAVQVGGMAVTIGLTNTYVSPVVVCSVHYDNNVTPVVTRVKNVSSTSFDVYLQNPSGGGVTTEWVSYLVVEEGVWTIDGVNIEAQTYLSTVTAENNNWSSEPQSYGQSYTNPVVIGQVMSDNDPEWSVFWCRGTSRNNPPSASTVHTGKTVCEDPLATRANETIGFIVIESGFGTIGGIDYEADLGSDSVRGVTNSPPFAYAFNAAFNSAPVIGLVTQAGMDGGNGGWAYTYGPTMASSTTLFLAIDEDQVTDNERNHTTEQVGYIVFENAVLYP